jgi:hypothetical protein
LRICTQSAVDWAGRQFAVQPQVSRPDDPSRTRTDWLASEERMPRVSEFFGIVIYMHYDDHPEPHFHATYGGREVKVKIIDLSVMAGGLNPRAMGLVIEWAAQHRAALRENWDRASRRLPLEKIPGLK